MTEALASGVGAPLSSLWDYMVYFSHDFWEDYGDPRVSKLPLMKGGPWKVCLISLTYVAFVKILGPMYMKGRKPFDLRPLMLLHNSFLIGVNGCGFFVGLWVTNFGYDTWKCQKLDPNNSTLKETLAIYLGYVYFLTKIVDFADTIFFVLRKKYNQASFLHVFHHGVMPIMSAVGLKFYPAGYSGFLPIINIFVHAVMYSYYALACAGEEMKKHLWWKKYITQIQMVQFVLVFFHSLKAMIMPNCWPFILAFAEGLHAILFFHMFFSFYRRAYWGNNNNTVDANNKNGDQASGTLKEKAN
ncbi:Elongation of very long chain fatty acids protein 1 [Halotydeus destructor]|nr:Elongation of very long chain fatty acids protein 1 [Halotydeus destructor]